MCQLVHEDYITTITYHTQWSTQTLPLPLPLKSREVLPDRSNPAKDKKQHIVAEHKQHRRGLHGYKRTF